MIFLVITPLFAKLLPVGGSAFAAQLIGAEQSSDLSLICEDDAPIRALVRAVVKREGFLVDGVENGESRTLMHGFLVCTLLPKPFDITKLAAVVRQCASECSANADRAFP